MNYATIAVIAGLVIVSTTILKVEAWRIRRRRAKFDELLAARLALPDADFAIKCDDFIDKDIAGRVRQVLAKVSADCYYSPKHPIEPHLLRPDDELYKELGFDLDSLSDMELVHCLEAEFGIKIPDSRLSSYEWSPSPTVRDIVRIIKAELGAHEQGK